MAQAGLTALQLPALDETHFIARGAFIMSLMLAFCSVFFSGLQQSSFGRAAEPKQLRQWLSSDVRWNKKTQQSKLQSFMVAHMILQAPFEIVVMSIMLFIVAFGTCLGSSWAHELQLSSGPDGNRAILIAFIIPTVFALVMYGHMMGLKDRELVRSEDKGDVEVMKLQGSDDGDLEVGSQIEIRYMSSIRKTASAREGVHELAEALKEAAEAHRQCAKADEQVAKLYERLLKKE